MLGWKVFGAGIPGLATQAICQDAAASLSAAGTTQGTALELSAADNEVSTVASGSGVVLSSKGTAGDGQSVFNSGANALNIYPPSGMQLNNLGANNPMTLAVKTGAFFKFLSSTRIMVVLSA